LFQDMTDFKDMKFKIASDCDHGLCHRACGRQDRQLNTYDWLYDIPGNTDKTDLVEVQFKNTRKGYYHNVNNIDLKKGDIVAVEATPGHDIGVVTLTGQLVKLQIKKANLKSADDIKRIYRIAKPVDMEKYREAKSREHDTMIQSRQIAKDLGLQMKIGDVEYQGDGNKAIFYYIADERVDFRQLIKVLAETFHVRIEMKQIGARQEAGRIGGTGPCGRELCCATWMKNFVSVSTNAARIQDISLNPQKLAGMCAKLKCCLNYEADDYVEARRKLPSKEIVLQTKDSDYYLVKSDILTGLVTYSTDKNTMSNVETISFDRAHEIINMNKRGEKPLSLTNDGRPKRDNRPADLLAEADISRFDKSKKKKKNNNSRNRNNKQANGANKTQNNAANAKRKDNSKEPAKQQKKGAPAAKQQ
jgi:cell fate regulator YaaT (PSP1 superfamily)